MPQDVTAAQLKAIAGANARSDLIAAIVRGWPAAVARAKITTRDRAAHFLAQIMTETGGLQILSESGAYRYETILKIFGAKQYSRQFGGRGHSAKVMPSEAKALAAMPVPKRGPALFNRVYGVGNPTKMKEFNNTGPNDGWLYRGGGMMQCTGKNNYAIMAKKTGLPLVEHPDLLHQPDSAFTAACLEWIQDGRCNAAADRDQVTEVRQIINGGQNGIDQCRSFLAKAKRALAGYGAAAPATLISQPDDGQDDGEDNNRSADLQQHDADGGAVEPDGDVAVPMAPISIDKDVKGDPELYAVQKRLKGRRYSPGIFDGRWGSNSAAAISGFANDRGLVIGQLFSLLDFHGVQEEIKAELSAAEAEGWFRPVSESRERGEAKVVATVAPEVVPAKRSFWAVVSAFFMTLFTAISDTISSWFSWAWDLFSEHKEDLPTDPETRSTIWEYVQAVPHGVWWCLALAAIGWLAYTNWSTAKQITTAVQTGERS